jgi:hypothetical protein
VDAAANRGRTLADLRKTNVDGEAVGVTWMHVDIAA